MLWTAVNTKTGGKCATERAEKNRDSNAWIKAHTAKTRSEKTENQHSLEMQHANIASCQGVERDGNTKEVVGRRYRLIAVHLNILS